MTTESTQKKIIDEINTERTRQIENENWSHMHDDDHEGEQLAMAAACYASPEQIYIAEKNGVDIYFKEPWPWGMGTTKLKKRHKERRKQLVIAAALIVAEIERLDRCEGWL
jgi:hypothetical protein